MKDVPTNPSPDLSGYHSLKERECEYMMKKRITAIVVFTVMLLTSVTTYGAEPFFNMGYWPNTPTVYQLNADDCIEENGAVVSTSGINFAGEGSVKYDFYLPFNSRGLTLKYTENNDAEVTVSTGQAEYTMRLTGESGEHNLLFYDYLGYEPTLLPYSINSGTTTRKEYTERFGDRVFTIKSTSAVKLTAVEFEKEKIHVSSVSYTPLNMNDTEKAIEETVFVDSDASMIMVRGGRRYINNENPKELPLNVEGRIYLPIGTLARALGYYYEDMPDKNYALLRCEPYEVSYLNGAATLTRNTAKPQEAEKDILIYHNGKTYAQVRYFAELLGKTVGFRDGIVVIDSKHGVEKILENSSVFGHIKQCFDEFRPQNEAGITYYVAQSESASDDNSGGLFAPFKTLEKAASVAKAGDTVIVREGTYRETLTPQNDGTATNPIVFKAAEGEEVILSAADEVTSKFVKYKDDIYTARVGWDLGDGKNQVYINGKAMVEARYPNGPAINTPEKGSPELSSLWPVKGDFTVVPGQLRVESEEMLNQPKDYWKGATYVGFFSHGWNLAMAKIEGSDTGSLTIARPDSSVVNGLAWWWWGDGGPVVPNHYGSWGQIQGHLNALDISEEWVINDGTLFMMFPEGAEPNKAKVEVKARQNVANLNGRKYVQLKGFETLGGSVVMNDSEMCMMDNMDMHYISHYTMGVDQQAGYIDGPVRNTLDKNGAPQRGEVGIMISGRDNIVINSSLDHSAGAGLYVAGLYSYIEDNILNDCGYMGSYVGGIFVYMEPWREKGYLTGGHGIYHNTVYNTGRSGFLVSNPDVWYTSSMIAFDCAFNDFHDGGITGNDGAIIYDYSTVCGTDTLQSGLHHNYVYNTRDRGDILPYVYGIYHDGNSMGIDTYNNVIFATDGNSKPTVDIYPQHEKVANSYHNIWGNTSPYEIADGAKGLKAENFPGGQPFWAGKREEPYMLNYERVSGITASVVIPAHSAKPSDGVTIDENGYAAFTEDGQYICFPDCDFTAGSSYQISLLYAGDKYLAGDKVKVVIGDRKADRSYGSVLDMKAPDLNQNNIWSFAAIKPAGIYDVWVEVEDYRSAKIAGIVIENMVTEDSDYSATVYAGTFSETETTQTDDFKVSVLTEYPASAFKPGIRNTWPVTWASYPQTLLTSASEELEISASTGPGYNMQPVEIRLGSPDGELIATYISDKEDWTDTTPSTIKLNRRLEKGVYDFYMVFPDYAGSGLSSNIYYFAFKSVK